MILQNGDIVPVSVKEGDKVLLPEYGGTKITLDEKVILYMFCRLHSDQNVKAREFLN